MSCCKGPWETCTGKIYDEKYEFCTKCGNRRLKGFEDEEEDETTSTYDDEYVEQLEAVAEEMRQSIENMISILDPEREAFCGELGAMNQAALMLDQYHKLKRDFCNE